MQARPLKTGIEQIVRAQVKEFYIQNSGINAAHIYLPTDLYNLFTDYMKEDVTVRCKFSGQPVPDFEHEYRYSFMGAEVHSHDGYDIIVTRDPLP